jgi:hypothetical protein
VVHVVDPSATLRGSMNGFDATARFGGANFRTSKITKTTESILKVPWSWSVS